ncbi:homing endonuclease associated repeat-containing protein [Sulfurovum sp. NBC37-1]|uniref:homing endonuclease associated repeat-containing protein n=1 Tax=Sulfurovum sp. (strain NBC37-1) TaxID=387093 RepID=UPI0001587603|nr:HNH endonuclease [Sulfurovum sp. NBC37-1]BAF72170.1 hypothetical protein SUN_1216 [Sulfurovum sp. NBC37-1]
MKFELKPDNRNSSDEDLISDLKKIAKELNKTKITRKEYDTHGRYSEGTLRKRFGGWIKALEKAGLSSLKDYEITKNDLIKELKRISNLPNVNILSRAVFNTHKKISNTSKIERCFGSWSNALKEAGLTVESSQNRYSNKDLFENILNVWIYHGKQPTVTQMSEEPSKITRNTYSNRFGNWRKTLEAFIEYTNQEEPEALIKEESQPKKLPLNSIHHKTSRTINLRLRFRTFQNDNFKCKNCGRSPATDPKTILHVDHIYPWSKGGETVLENLQTLCSDCNLGKSDLV